MLLQKIKHSSTASLPEFDRLDDYLDYLIPYIKPWSEDLYETDNYLDTRWLEINDFEDDDDESILHIFQEEGDYMYVLSGDIHKGTWKMIKRSNTLIIERSSSDKLEKSELYDLAYLSKDFFILKKHGNQQILGLAKYLLLARENYVKGMGWEDVIFVMFRKYRNNVLLIRIAIGLILLVILVAVFKLL